MTSLLRHSFKRHCEKLLAKRTMTIYLNRFKHPWVQGFHEILIFPAVITATETLSTDNRKVQRVTFFIGRLSVFSYLQIPQPLSVASDSGKQRHSLLFPRKYIYLSYRHECFTGKYTTHKIHKNYIRDPSGLFSIISHVSLSMT